MITAYDMAPHFRSLREALLGIKKDTVKHIDDVLNASDKPLSDNVEEYLTLDKERLETEIKELENELGI